MAALIILAVLCLSPVLVRPETSLSCPHDSETKCKDLKTAIECGSLIKCLDTKWAESKGELNPCTMCKELAAAVDKVVENKSVQDDFNAVLLKICSLIPSKPLSDKCTTYVHAFLPLVIDFMKNELKDPATLCAALCVAMPTGDEDVEESNAVRELEPSHNIYLRQQTEIKRQVEHLPQCELCLLVLKELEKILPTERTKALILKELNQICSVVPKRYSEKCKELVKDDGAIIIDMILNQLGPNAICFGLKLCFTDSSAELTDELGRPTCDVCEKMENHLSLGQKSGTDMVKTCSSWSGATFLLCEDFVYAYKPQLEMMLPDKSKDICKELRLCVRLTTEKLLGKNDCTWGPRHWCSDKAIAARCKSTEYCEEKGWL
ncbi:pulmonary surfactant-associated protein B [Amblyraja radiata]|uniref:pulmonary surfactant-associated protein B n=1 Tax=Amblyraja radiata TaxID=386614 RepID=UPI0014036DD0|nr:pulmonary surfactant-associated protein B [Amblyraja radiata]